MRALIVEDEFLGRRYLKALMNPLFEVDIVVNGVEAVEAFRLAHAEGRPYGLILMDIMLPQKDGIEALKDIRALEREQDRVPAKVVMITALSDPKTVLASFDQGGASGYVVKPLDRERLYAELRKIGLIGG
ncbi:MAG: response regulator [Desulfovibrionaceae bacterium]|nr:response regulator [Desulfovibrionaceae bacterium]MDD4951663.1 response regulator [Desulfovibrionaceae bacterium]